MRVMTNGNFIEEVNKVQLRENGIFIGSRFYETWEDTPKIVKQLLENGYADLRPYHCSII